MLRGYQIGTGSVAVIWGTSFAGWVIAAVTGTYLREYTGLGGTLIVGAAVQLIAHSLRFWVSYNFFFFFFFFFSLCGVFDVLARCYILLRNQQLAG